jgi:hypothetical protein
MRFYISKRLGVQIVLFGQRGIDADGERGGVDGAGKLSLYDERLAEINADGNDDQDRYDEQNDEDQDNAFFLAPKPPEASGKYAPHLIPPPNISRP